MNTVSVPVRPFDGPIARDRRRGLAALVLLAPDLAVTGRFDVQPLRQRVDDAHADAVQAAGHLVAAAAELATGVQHGVHDLERVAAGLLVLADRHTAAVVAVGDAAVGVDASARCATRDRPSPRRSSCRRSPRRGDAGRARRSSRCTCPAACGRPRGPRGPGCSRPCRRAAAAGLRPRRPLPPSSPSAVVEH